MFTKRSFRFTCSHFSAGFSLGATIVVTLAMVSPLAAQTKSKPQLLSGGTAAAQPPSRQKSVQIMVEMSEDAAAVPYAAALQVAQAEADAARNYALAHPTLKSSVALLNQGPQRVQVTATVSSQIKATVQRLDQAQRQILPTLTGPGIGGQVIYRVQKAYNGIAMVVSPDKISQIAKLPGVKAVHPIVPKFLTAAFSDIDFLNVRRFWTTGVPGTHGETIKVGDIDTGLDYIHRNFGGSGSASDYAATNDTSPVPNANFPTAKIPGGTDLVGDSYNADPTSPTFQPIPHPDNNPFDCNGHGTATASLIGGLGVTNAGFTYSGTYDASNPNMNSLKVSPGLAPGVELYPIRVFGCAGSTNVVAQAIEFAMDPNGDGDFSDHLDVINMSLGANEGFADDPDAVAASNAAAIGMIVCSAAGNAGDSYYIHSSPAAASGTLGVAATFNNQGGFIFDSNVTSNTAGGGGVGTKYFSTQGSNSSPIPAGGITGNVVYAVPNNASGPLTNAAQVAGNICLIDRGAVTFTSKIQQAFNAGATAVIINNFTCVPNCSVPILMATTGQPAITDVMISRNDRDTIVAAAGGFDATTGLPTNPVNVTINNDSGADIIPSLAAPDTIPTYSSRGPRLPDSATKPDIAAPAEVVGVAQPFTGNGVENFNGTSSATPHVSGEMAMIRQLHPTWSVQEVLALACNTATHDLFTDTTHTTKFGVGRIGAGRIDLRGASLANVVAFNGTDPNLIGVSFGVVETPIDGSTTLTKNITVENKGTTNVTYKLSIANNPAVGGTRFTLPGGNSLTINAGATMTIPVQFSVTPKQLKHRLEASVAPTQEGSTPTTGNPRQWLTESGGYVVFTPNDGSPTLRVELYAAAKPVSSIHATTNGVVPATPNTGSFNLTLSGAGVNTGPNLGFGFDILSLVKPLELQFASPLAGQPNGPTDPNIIKYVGITSDFVNGAGEFTTIVFGIDGFGDAATPDFASSDREIFIDTDPTHTPATFNPNFVVFLTSNGGDNVFVPALVDLTAGTELLGISFTNGVDPGTADTNAYNNSAVVIDVNTFFLGLAGAGQPTKFLYVVATFDRNGNLVDVTPNVLAYDVAKPGLEVEDSGAVAGVGLTPAGSPPFEPFYYNDVSANTIPINYNGANFIDPNGPRGVLLLHMHNGDGNRSDVVAFLKPTVTGFSPTSGKVGTQVTITGSNFGPGTTVTFTGKKVASINVITSKTLVATVPAGAVTGKITVSNAAGSAMTGVFTVTP